MNRTTIELRIKPALSDDIGESHDGPRANIAKLRFANFEIKPKR